MRKRDAKEGRAVKGVRVAASNGERGGASRTDEPQTQKKRVGADRKSVV